MSHPPAQPPTFNATPESILQGAKQTVETGKAVQSQVLASVLPESATFDNTLLPLVHEENERLRQCQWVEFLGNVAEAEQVRKACDEAEKLFSNFATEAATCRDLYALLLAVHRNEPGLSGERRRLLDKMLLEAQLKGLGLSDDEKTRLKVLNEELDQIKAEYLKPLSEPAVGDLWFRQSELEGLAEHSLAEMERGSGVHDGKLRLEIAGTMQFYGFLARVKRSEIRRQIYVGYAKNFQSNVGLLERALPLRHEKAVLLGYSSYAELIMATMMEKSPKNIEAFLENLLVAVSPARDVFLSRCRQMKAQDLAASGQPGEAKFYAWDHAYYGRLVWERDNDLSVAEVAEYFSLSETTTRMLAIFETVFGLKFISMDKASRDNLAQGASGDSLVWHEDVQMFAVWDASDPNAQRSEFVGYLYMDMYPRPGKRSGFSDLPIYPAYTTVDGSRIYTSTCLVCNFDRPTKDRPTLLSHGKVELVFHELGHAIHDLVAKTEFARFHGASTAADFNEAPSQLLENWCWTPTTLRMLSQRWNSARPEALPDSLIEKLVLSRRRANSGKTLALLRLSIFDLALKGPHTALDTTELYHATMHRVSGLDIPSELSANHATDSSHFDVSAMHVYLISQAYSSDMFSTVFERNPMDSKEGDRYRRTILQKGSSVDELEMLTEFLGRAPNLEALYKGLVLD